MMQIKLLALLVLALCLAVAVWHDVRTRRIPNRLIVLGTLAAMALHVVIRPGAGLFSADPGGLGILFSMSGFAVGLLLLLPFYALKTMGAGDVKLMAMVGAFVGIPAVIGATLLTMLCGGVLALVLALRSGHLGQTLSNLQQMLRMPRAKPQDGGEAQPARRSLATGKLPYAIAIACGTAGQLLLAGSPGWRLFS